MKRPLLGRTDPFLPLLAPFMPAPTPSHHYVSFFWTHRPFRALRAPFLDALTPSRPNGPFFDAPTTSCPVLGRADLSLLDFGRADPFLPGTVPFRMRRPLPAPFLDSPTPSCPELSFFGPVPARFGRADPFLPRTVLFWTRRPLLAQNCPFSDAL